MDSASSLAASSAPRLFELVMRRWGDSMKYLKSVIIELWPTRWGRNRSTFLPLARSPLYFGEWRSVSSAIWRSDSSWKATSRCQGMMRRAKEAFALFGSLTLLLLSEAISGWVKTACRRSAGHISLSSFSGAPPFVESLSCTRMSGFCLSTAARISRRQFLDLKYPADRKTRITAEDSMCFSSWSISLRSSTSKKIFTPGSKLVRDRFITATWSCPVAQM
mmetsp:Transcript_27401/g.83343  ORF Transcript_27401/g.83343 Transcript_27401/m.83343 type:complete len:220 (-) Transcript_27401:292-951(-)